MKFREDHIGFPLFKKYYNTLKLIASIDPQDIADKKSDYIIKLDGIYLENDCFSLHGSIVKRADLEAAKERVIKFIEKVDNLYLFS